MWCKIGPSRRDLSNQPAPRRCRRRASAGACLLVGPSLAADPVPAADLPETLQIFGHLTQAYGLSERGSIQGASEDGTELAISLIDRHPGLRVLFVSGYPTETLRERQAMLPPSMRFLHKPFTPSALVTAVREVLEEPVASAEAGRQALLDLSPRS